MRAAMPDGKQATKRRLGQIVSASSQGTGPAPRTLIQPSGRRQLILETFF
jgi:hypothetical protein